MGEDFLLWLPPLFLPSFKVLSYHTYVSLYSAKKKKFVFPPPSLWFHSLISLISLIHFIHFFHLFIIQPKRFQKNVKKQKHVKNCPSLFPLPCLSLPSPYIGKQNVSNGKKRKEKKTVNSILYVGLLKWIQFRTYVHVPKDDDTFFSPPFFFPLQEREEKEKKKKKELKRWQKFENNSIVCMFFIVM